ncbi:MAG: glycine cleavage system aminomethyltransferase GcvT [Deferribacteres bacterium]|nr:glycine cleavage system aminomethyltransferase GcvT [candidate division KSB1 bacterium]MCB9504206.1 glycine cleavage system aminomethyltransferase GcvT [Deferribacteres bacterium]
MSVKKTALYDVHVNAGAKIVEFAGYLMPVQYAGIIQEHNRVRASVGLFDVSHMGEFSVHGAGALDFLQKMTINDVAALSVNQAQYSAMCYDDGGIVDDLIVYRHQNFYGMVVNASNLQKDFDWLQEHLPQGVELRNESEETSLVALQGRDADATLQKLTEVDLGAIKFYWFAKGEVAGIPALISRTGYTGESGFEIAVPNEDAVQLWNAIMEAGAEFNIEPIGLGARDTLRLEMKYCLYGNDIDATTNPIEAGLGWITKLGKGPFIGSDVLTAVKENGPKRKLVGLELDGRNIARHGYEILSGTENIGIICSGSKSISLDKSIATGYIAAEHAAVGTEVGIQIRNRVVPAKVVKTPFYQRPY